MADPNSRAKCFLLRDSGTVVPLLTNAASAPWCPSHAARAAGGRPAPHVASPRTRSTVQPPAHQLLLVAGQWRSCQARRPP